jgi:hypothetical protein
VAVVGKETDVNLDQARELRQELEAVEATMERIRELWQSAEFPTAEELYDLGKNASDLLSTLEAIPVAVENLPPANDLDDLDAAVRNISGSMDAIIEKASEMPEIDG